MRTDSLVRYMFLYVCGLKLSINNKSNERKIYPIVPIVLKMREDPNLTSEYTQPGKRRHAPNPKQMIANSMFTVFGLLDRGADAGKARGCPTRETRCGHARAFC